MLGVAEMLTLTAALGLLAVAALAAAGTAALGGGTPIQLVTCNGNPVQRFTLSAAGDLVNVSANRCVDIAAWNNSNGAQLHLWDCVGGANQKWTRA